METWLEVSSVYGKSQTIDVFKSGLKTGTKVVLPATQITPSS